MSASLYCACLALGLLLAWHGRLSTSMAPEKKVLIGVASDLQVNHIAHVFEILQRVIVTFVKIIVVLLTLMIVAIYRINIL